MTAEAALAVGRCGCPEYTTDPAAFGMPIDIVDLVELRLRRPSEPRFAEPSRLAPARDLFDEGRRLRDLGEAKPWRPFE